MRKYGIDNGRELCAALACYWLVCLGFYMVLRPAEFSYFVMKALPI